MYTDLLTYQLDLRSEALHVMSLAMGSSHLSVWLPIWAYNVINFRAHSSDVPPAHPMVFSISYKRLKFLLFTQNKTCMVLR